MHLDELPRDLLPDTPLTIHCRTSKADIYYKGAHENGRVPIRPTPYQLMEIPYTLHGVFDHYRLDSDMVPCLVIRSSESGKMQRVYIGGIRRIRYDRIDQLAQP